MAKHALLITCFLLAVACSRMAFDENTSPLYGPVGSSLELHQVIDIAPDRLAIYMQGGAIMDYSAIDKYYPHCKFELYNLSEHARKVHPDIFRIEQIKNETDLSSARPTMYAGPLHMSDDSEAGPSVITFTTSMFLRSETQPEVYRMSCMHWDLPSESRYLSIAEIRKAMGTIFTLRINDGERLDSK